MTRKLKTDWDVQPLDRWFKPRPATNIPDFRVPNGTASSSKASPSSLVATDEQPNGVIDFTLSDSDDDEEESDAGDEYDGESLEATQAHVDAEDERHLHDGHRPPLVKGKAKQQNTLAGFAFSEDDVAAWERELDERRGRPRESGEDLTREEVTASLVHLFELVTARYPASHSKAETLRARYMECIHRIDAVRDRHESWFRLFASAVVIEDRFTFFLAGTSEQEARMLAADEPPDVEHYQLMVAACPAESQSVWGCYSLILPRPDKRPMVYEGVSTANRRSSAAKSLSSDTVFGIAARFRGHLAKARNPNRRAPIIHHTAKKLAVEPQGYCNFSVQLPGVELNRRGLLVALTIALQYSVEAVRHEWLNTFLNDRPSTFWTHRHHQGANRQQPATQSVARLSFYTQEQRVEKKLVKERERQRRLRAAMSRQELDELAAHKLKLKYEREALEDDDDRRARLDENNRRKRVKTARTRAEETGEEAAERKAANSAHWKTYGAGHRAKIRATETEEEKAARLAADNERRRLALKKNRAKGVSPRKKTEAEMEQSKLHRRAKRAADKAARLQAEAEGDPTNAAAAAAAAKAAAAHAAAEAEVAEAATRRAKAREEGRPRA